MKELRQQGLGDHQLVLDSDGQISAQTTPLEQFGNRFTSKPSSPQQKDAFQKLQAMLERDYGSVGRDVLSPLVGNETSITVNEATEVIKQAKNQFQMWQNQCLLDIQLVAWNKFANNKGQASAQRILSQMMHALQPTPEQVQCLRELIMCAQSSEEICNFAYMAMANPTYIKDSLTRISTLNPGSQSQEYSNLLLSIDINREIAINRMNQLLELEPKQAQVLRELINTSSPKEMFTFVHATENNPKVAYDFLSNLATLSERLQSEELLSSLQNLSRSNFAEARRWTSAYTKMMEYVKPNEAQKQVLLEFIRQKGPRNVLDFAQAATNNPIGAREFLSKLSRLESNLRSKEFSSLFAAMKRPFVECTSRFSSLLNANPIANAANQIRNAVESNPVTDGFARTTQGAAEIAKHLITAPGQLANEGFILGLKTMLAEGQILPNTNNAFLAEQLDRLQHAPGLQAQLMNIGKNGISPVAHQAIRETLGLPPGAPITPKEAQQAALAALLSPLRQGDVGSCFATFVAINIHDTRPSEMLRDMASLIEKGFIERQNGNAHVQIPF
ncbi:MAG: hypothetical protein LBJ78_04670, partial [Puniceicoccales bacterium]|nr:hypothetical protein [Puniceicoccales bacterium]